MAPRRGLHRPLQGDLVIDVVRRRLRRFPVRGDRLVEVAGFHRRLALAKRLACRAATGGERGGDEKDAERPFTISDLQSHPSYGCPDSRSVTRPRPSA
jgi:hypothetical protein